MKTLRAVDLFCGAGGASTSLIRAATALGLEVDLVAVNHWPTAIETHTRNHPGVRHLCESVERVDPLQVIRGGHLHLLMAGPECTHFARARGGKPMSNQSRSSAWHILKWAQELYIDTILIENVEEFREWGPLGVNGKPLKSKKGQTYRAFLAALESLDYQVEDRILCAADYGDPTTRRRLFIIARRGRRSVTWPTPTHSKMGGRTLFGQTKKWRAAREVIDFTIPSRSIFDPTRRPLSTKTIARVMAGLERFGGPELKPFLVVLRNHMAGRSLNDPLPALAAQGTHMALCEPFLLATGSNGAPRPVSAPAPTVVGAASMMVVEPFVLSQASGGAPRSVDQPIPTLCTDGYTTLIEPFIVPPRGFSQGAVDSVERPLRTIVAASGHNFAVVQPFIASYYGTKNVTSVNDPLRTITTKDRFALVMPVVDGFALDIRLRMLKPRELARATSFPDSYEFAGNQGDVVKQIGNAWPGELGRQLTHTLIQEYAVAGKPKPLEIVA